MRGIIYKIEFNENLYVGSTIDLHKRQIKHNSDYRKTKNYKLYEKAREYNIEEIELILLEEIEFEDIDELRIKEEEYRIKLNANLNEIACYRNDESYKEYYKKNKIEYYKKNKDKILEYKKEYDEKNKNKLNQKFICFCGGYYTHNHKATHLKTKKHQQYIKDNSAP